jgi:hypothetical protein
MQCNILSSFISHTSLFIYTTCPDLVVYLTRLFQDTGIILRFATGKTSHGDAVQKNIIYSFPRSKTWPDLVVYLTRLFQDTGIILRFAIGKASHGDEYRVGKFCSTGIILRFATGKTSHGDAVQKCLTYSFSQIQDLA